MYVKDSYYLKLCAEQGYDKVQFSKGFNFIPYLYKFLTKAYSFLPSC